MPRVPCGDSGESAAIWRSVCAQQRAVEAESESGRPRWGTVADVWVDDAAKRTGVLYRQSCWPEGSRKDSLAWLTLGVLRVECWCRVIRECPSAPERALGCSPTQSRQLRTAATTETERLGGEMRYSKRQIALIMARYGNECRACGGSGRLLRRKPESTDHCVLLGITAAWCSSCGGTGVSGDIPAWKQ